MASVQRVAVVGATGAVGQTTLKLLKERNFPVREVRAFASERSVGKTVKVGDDSIRVERLDAAARGARADRDEEARGAPDLVHPLRVVRGRDRALDERQVVPRFLHEAARAAPHP